MRPGCHAAQVGRGASAQTCRATNVGIKGGDARWLLGVARETFDRDHKRRIRQPSAKGVQHSTPSYVYLHYVADLWAHQWRLRGATGNFVFVRYADNVVAGFEHEADARHLWDVMRKWLERCGLELHGERTRSWSSAALRRDAAEGTTGQAGDLQLPGVHVHLRQICGVRRSCTIARPGANG